MSSSDELAAAAIRLADDLESGMRWSPGEHGRGWWTANSHESKPVIRARATAALDFLARCAGPESQWSSRARAVMDSNGDHESMESGAWGVAAILREWARQVSAGIVSPRLADQASARVVAATDLMGQVEVLMADRSVHPAAPIVLCGAALEVALRSAVDDLGLTTNERPSIMAFARCLRTEGVLSAQQVKDAEAMAGMRNSAAHGEFDDLSRERAGLMQQHVNLFLAVSTLQLGRRKPCSSATSTGSGRRLAWVRKLCCMSRRPVDLGAVPVLLCSSAAPRSRLRDEVRAAQ